MIKSYGKHLEITNLVIPNKNDDSDTFIEMVKWIRIELGTNTPLHLSKYFPRFKLNIPSTPDETLINLYHLAKKELNYVYLGNYHNPEFSSTYCPSCNHLIVERNGYTVNLADSFLGVECPKCKTQIPIKTDLLT
jgi:pyruvate formate lyase activating enzyme